MLILVQACGSSMAGKMTAPSWARAASSVRMGLLVRGSAEPGSARSGENNLGRGQGHPAPERRGNSPKGGGLGFLALFLIGAYVEFPWVRRVRTPDYTPFVWIFVATRRRNHRSPRSSSPSASVSRTSLRRSSGRSPQAHREWLLEQHGPVCAYCGAESLEHSITLDHVTPRRGKSAYDRPDNLVLACRTCNAEKADKPLLAFLLAKRSRGVFLAHYGEHLSEPLLDLARKASERPMSPSKSA